MYRLKIPLMALLPREAKRKSWRPRMRKGNVDAKRIAEGSWGRRMVRD